MTAIAQRRFSGGEISPALYAGTDLQKFAISLRTMRNFVLQRYGGAMNRPGFDWINEVKDSSKTVRIEPWTYNEDQSYLLEFGDQYMRVIRNGSPITLTGQNITAISNATEGVVTYAGADTYANGDEVYMSGIVGDIGDYLNGRNFLVSDLNTGANTFKIKYLNGTYVNTTAMGSYTSGGTVAEVYTLATPYLEADLSRLQMSMTEGVMTIASNGYITKELTRSGHTSWTLGDFETAAFSNLDNPAGVSISGGAAGTERIAYKVSSVNSLTGEESGGKLGFITNKTQPTVANPISGSWTTIPGADEYNVYRETYDGSGLFGFIMTVADGAFVDTGYTPDPLQNPPGTDVGPLLNFAADYYPGVVAYCQRRRFFGRTNNEVESIWGSRIENYAYFRTQYPTPADGAFHFKIAQKRQNEVRHIIDLGSPIVLTNESETACQGGTNGVLTPADINPKTDGYNGSSYLPPLVIDKTAIFLQSDERTVRDLTFDLINGFKGKELTNWADHLVKGKSIVSWAYQKHPNSIVWAVRDDGVLLGLTYIKDQEIWGWHRHDTEGFFENVAVVKEGTEDVVYVVVRRTINGATKRYIERMHDRVFDDVKDAKFVDCGLSYDGRNTGGTTMTLSKLALTITGVTKANPAVATYVGTDPTNGDRFAIASVAGMTQLNGNTYMVANVNTAANTCELWAQDGSAPIDSSAYGTYTSGGTMTQDWTQPNVFTLTASASYFAAADVGNEIQLFVLDDDDEITDTIRCEVLSYTSATVVKVRADKNIHADWQGVAGTDWAKAVDEIGGLWHLEGKSLAGLGDGNVIASPYNSNVNELTVENGAVELDGCYAVIRLGLPYLSDLETLNVDTPQGPSIHSDLKKIHKLKMQVEDTRGLFAGPCPPADDEDNAVENLDELKIRNQEAVGENTRLFTGDEHITIASEWNSNGRVFLRQVDPLPATIMALIPDGMFPFRG